jgi:hypothetical protein
MLLQANKVVAGDEETKIFSVDVFNDHAVILKSLEVFCTTIN